MTALTFLIGGALAWLHFEIVGRVIAPGVTVWIGWYAVVLAALAFHAWRSRDKGTRAAALIMLASFLAAHLIWNASAWPIAAHSLKNIVVAAGLFAVALAFQNRIIFLAGALHLAIVGIGAASDLGFIFGGKRPMQFIAWSFPDVSAGLQHAALLVLSLRNREREGASVERDSGYGGFRWVSGVASVAMRKIAR